MEIMRFGDHLCGDESGNFLKRKGIQIKTRGKLRREGNGVREVNDENEFDKALSWVYWLRDQFQ